MERLFRGVLVFVLAGVFALALIACDDDSDDSGSGGKTYTVFYDAAKNVLPAYTDASRANWSLGSPIYELYGILEDDEDVDVGYFNIYDSLKTADERFTEAMANGSTITDDDFELDYEHSHVLGSTEYSIYHQYTDGGYSSETYVHQDGSYMSMLNILVNNTGDENSKSFVEGRYDESTGDVMIEIFMANKIDEGSNTGWELVRAYFEGNTENHTFTLKVVRGGTGYDHNVLGSGVSQGDGYFLLNLANDSVELTGTARFYTIDADATVDELKALDDEGFETADAAGDTEDHASGFLAPFTVSDLPAGQTEAESLDLSAPAPDLP
ncbi:MAG: hypothetical protein ACOC2H_05170 [Spirochaetota bacterium]